MSKLWKYSYYVYLIIVAILVFEGVLRLDKDIKLSMIFFAIAAMVLVKFFITKRFRSKIEKRNQQN